MKLLLDFFPIILFFVAFKVWGTMPITILFTLSQMPLIMRHAIETPEESKGP